MLVLLAQASEAAQARTSWALNDPGSSFIVLAENANLMTVFIHRDMVGLPMSDRLSSLKDTNSRRLAGVLKNCVLHK